MSNPSSGRIPLVLAILKAQWRVLVALMLRDIKTRWGSSFGFLLTAIWPITHILVLIAIYVSLGRIAPYGESSVLWFSISMIPFIIFSYVSRFIVYGIISNKSLLVFPVIKVTDILFSRMLIEVVNIAFVIVLLCGILWFQDVDFMPFDMKNAAFALGASLLLGLGAGILNALTAALFHMWVTGYALLTILVWMTSGVLFVPNALPAYLRDILYYQPVVHLVEWMREAYYPGYNSLILDKVYVLGWGVVLIGYGLLVERLARGRVVINI